MIKAIIFDCFGVFIGDLTKAHLADLAKADPAKVDEFRAITHSLDKGILSDEEGMSLQANILGMPIDTFRVLRTQHEVRNEALIEFVASLKGKFKLAMLSNINSRERLDIRFEPGQLDQLFEHVIASGDVGYIKPQPEIFEIALQKFGVLPEECVMIDDIELFCDAARGVGMHAIQFMNNEQVITDLTALIDRGGKTD